MGLGVTATNEHAGAAITIALANGLTPPRPPCPITPAYPPAGCDVRKTNAAGRERKRASPEGAPPRPNQRASAPRAPAAGGGPAGRRRLHGADRALDAFERGRLDDAVVEQAAV